MVARRAAAYRSEVPTMTRIDDLDAIVRQFDLNEIEALRSSGALL